MINTSFSDMPWLRDKQTSGAALAAGRAFSQSFEGAKDRGIQQQQIDIRKAAADQEAKREAQKLIGAQLFTKRRSELLAAGRKEEEANMVALMEALPLIHPEGLPNFVSRENTLNSRAEENERTRTFKANESEKTRQSQYDRLIETLNSKANDLATKLQSAETVATKNNVVREAIANSRSDRKISRDEFINRHAGNIHRADPSQSYKAATQEAGDIYDSTFGSGGGAQGAATQGREETTDEKALKQLYRAEEMKLGGGKVDSAGDFIEGGARAWDTSVPDLIEETIQKLKLKGIPIPERPQKKPSSSLPMIPFNFNSKSNSLSPRF